MAGGSLLALLDDIATVLDDVSVMTKMAAKKTSGVLGDDLALNAQQVAGVRAEREIPVVWAVAKGSFLNKLILVPLALLINAFAPWAVTPLLMVGGAFLCFEGAEKLAHKFLHKAGDEPVKRHRRKIFRHRKSWLHSRNAKSKALSAPILCYRRRLLLSPSVLLPPLPLLISLWCCQ